MNWVWHKSKNITFKVPDFTRQMRNWSLYKGRLDRENSKTEILIALDIGLADAGVDAIRQSVTHESPIKSWMGTTWDNKNRGLSLTRKGGYEVKGIQIAPDGTTAHRWTIIFPINKVWIHLDISNARGGLTWEDFELLSEEIINSVR